ncbi:class I SAM-dependent methyltransferase [Ferroplasma acidiphilum]|uniref:class I SAM-dependent methyltransferase n=1 Tax=Ferroplasma acidiphilum TaxID=74969 RepID=UPI0023F535AA|nr:class I SAM-dependent methyltransferase [Ferroplasma acidiphilum]
MAEIDFGTYHHSSLEESIKVRALVEEKMNQVLGNLYPATQKINILDAGCGLGFMTSIAAKHFHYASITGIDIFNHDSLSGSSMEKALQNMKELGIDNRVLLINHNLLTPFTMGTKFDLAMSNLVFHNLGKNRFKAHDNVIECLNGGGYFILIDLLPEQSIDMNYLRNSFSTVMEIPITGNGKWDLQMKVFQKI